MTSPHSPITLGEATRSRTISGYVLTETVHAAGRFLPRHSHEHANIALVQWGDFVELVGKRRWNCRTGSTILKPAGAEHSNRYGAAGMACLVVEMLPESGLGRDFHDAIGFEDARLAHLAGVLREEMAATDTAAALVLESVVLQIAANIIRIRTPRERAIPKWIRTMQGTLHARSGQTLRITDVARELGIHPTHAVREFRRHLGLTPGEYLRRLRVERARALLCEGMPLAEVAVAAGFAHQSHFSRIFKRYHHVTPRQWLLTTQR